jgi:Peptidase inhibitor I9
MRSFITLAAAAASLPFTAMAMPPPEALSEQIKGKYIVVMNPSHELGALGISRKGTPLANVKPSRTYNHATFKGFAAPLSSSQINALRSDPRVLYVEEDGVLRTQEIQDIRDTNVVKTERDSTWGLGRIS